MKLGYVLLAEKILLEMDVFTPTAINILDEIGAFQMGPKVEPTPARIVLPFPCSLLTFWKREDSPAGTYPTEIAFIGPNDIELDRFDGPEVVWGGKDSPWRFYGRQNFFGIPTAGSGDHRIAVYLKGEAIPVGEWQFKVLITTEAPEGFQVPREMKPKESAK